MRDKDSQLIFENYEKDILLNEAAPLFLILVPPALAFISGQLHFTSETLEWIKKKTNGILDIQAILDIPVVDFALNFVDVTGLSYWPKLEKSMDEYKLNPSPENFGEVAFNLFGTFPVIGRLRGAFAAIKGGKTALKEAPIIYKFLAWVFEKVTDNIFKKPEFIKQIKKIFTSSPKQVQQRIIAIFSVLGTKWMVQELSAIGAESAAENAAEKPKTSPQPKPLSTPTEGKYPVGKRVKPDQQTPDKKTEPAPAKSKSKYALENLD